MTDAPERIWADPWAVSMGVPDWAEGQFWSVPDDAQHQTAYVRADLHDALAAENARLRFLVASLQSRLGLSHHEGSDHMIKGKPVTMGTQLYSAAVGGGGFGGPNDGWDGVSSLTDLGYPAPLRPSHTD